MKFKNLRYHMMKNGDTQETLAGVLNVSTTTLNSKITGKTEWRKNEIDILIARYCSTYEELFKED